MPPLQSFRERGPAAALAGHVVCVWIQRVEPGSAPYAHRTIPHGSAELVHTAGVGLRVVGPQTRPRARSLPAGTTRVGLRFQPAAAAAVLRVPPSELVDRDLDLVELWGASGLELSEELAAAGSASQAAVRLERAVAARLADARGLDPVVGEVVRRLLAGPRTEVGTLASSLFISERQLRRRCEAAIGLSPKVLQRMLRFQRFLALAGTRDRPSEQLARLSAEAGYADQSHLHREATRLEGRSPRTLLLDAEHKCGCAHDHAPSHEPFLRPG